MNLWPSQTRRWPQVSIQVPGQLLHRLSEVVVVDLHRGDPAQLLERGDMPREERFLRQRRIDPMNCLPRVIHPEHEDEDLGAHPGEADPELAEINLRTYEIRRFAIASPVSASSASARTDPKPCLEEVPGRTK